MLAMKAIDDRLTIEHCTCKFQGMLLNLVAGCIKLITEMMGKAAASGVGSKGVPTVACEQKAKGELQNLRENSNLACTIHAARHHPENPARLLMPVLQVHG